MLKKFTIESILNHDEDPHDRQKRISWLSQEKLFKAKVMVVGAGAIGNETLKNLALLGIGNIFIVDFDTVSTSNLSRTVLFKKSDIRKNKAEIAAERTRELSLYDNTNIDWFHGDLVWDLGSGIYKEMDIVLGCLDNTEARFAVNRFCHLAGTPWIDAGIHALTGSVSVYESVPHAPCYECGATKEQMVSARKRYSCDDFKRSMFKDGIMPTVQITSSIVSAIQVQEAIKILCGQEASISKKIYFEGKTNYFDVIPLSYREDCLTSARTPYPDIIPLPLSCSATLREFLKYVSNTSLSGDGAMLDIREDLRTFVISVNCRHCGEHIYFHKPSFRISDTDTICPKCKDKGIDLKRVNADVQAEKLVKGVFSLNDKERILDTSLYDIGIPYLHIVAVMDRNGIYKYYELAGDKKQILQNITKGGDDKL